MCLAEFASTSYNAKDNVDNDALPDSESQASTKKITLTGGSGLVSCMSVRSQL